MDCPAPTPIQLDDEAATERLAVAIAGVARAGDVIALSGELGAGKTVFARAFIHASGGAGEEVPSPTFTLVQRYELARCPVNHFDLFRVEAPGEVVELGLEDALGDGITLIEWPERMGGYLPADRLDVQLCFAVGRNSRRAQLLGHGDWVGRLRGLTFDG